MWAMTDWGAINRRRSQRVVVNIPVVVSGELAQSPFREETETLVINAHGALVKVVAKVTKGQQVKLKSRTHPEVQACRVVYIGPSSDGKTQVGVEFTERIPPHFWRVAFPPADWTPLPLDDPEMVKKGKR